MEHKHKDFDNFFQNKLDNRPFEFKDDFWTEMETLLPEDNTDVAPTGRPRRRFVWGILLLCFIGTMTFILYPNRNKNALSSIKNSTSKHSTIKQQDNDETIYPTTNANLTKGNNTKESNTEKNNTGDFNNTRIHQHTNLNSPQKTETSSNFSKNNSTKETNFNSPKNDNNRGNNTTKSVQSNTDEIWLNPSKKRPFVLPNTIKSNTTSEGDKNIFANTTTQRTETTENNITVTGENGEGENPSQKNGAATTNQSQIIAENQPTVDSPELVDVFNKEFGNNVSNIDEGKESNLPFLLTKQLTKINQTDEAALESIEPNCDGCPYVPSLHSLRIGLVAGLSGSQGWKNAMSYRARPSFDPTVGLRLSYLHSPISDWSFNAEIQYWSRSGLNSNFSYDSTSYGFGSTTVSKTIDVEELHYISLPLYSVYTKKQHQFMGGLTIGYLLNTHSTTTGTQQSTTANSTENLDVPYTQQWGYTTPFNRLNLGVTLGYDYEIMSGWKIGTRINYGLNDIAKNDIFNNNTLDNNLNIKVILTCDLLELKF